MQEATETQEPTIPTARRPGAYWSAETNRARSEKLKGRTLSFDQRAQMYASHITGKRATDNDPEWQQAYQDRLGDLRMQEHLRQLVEQGDVPLKPLDVPLTTQVGKLMKASTVCRIDPKILATEMRRRNLNFETLRELAGWIGLSRQEIEDVLAGRMETVAGK